MKIITAQMIHCTGKIYNYVYLKGTNFCDLMECHPKLSLELTTMYSKNFKSVFLK